MGLRTALRATDRMCDAEDDAARAITIRGFGPKNTMNKRALAGVGKKYCKFVNAKSSECDVIIWSRSTNEYIYSYMWNTRSNRYMNDADTRNTHYFNMDEKAETNRVARSDGESKCAAHHFEIEEKFDSNITINN